MRDDLSSKKQQLKLLKSGKGLQNLLSQIYEILGNPIATFDLHYNLLAYAEGVVTDDPLWNELISTGAFGAEALALFKSENWIDAVANSGTMTLMTSDKLKYDRINGKIFDKDKTRIANLIVIACDKPFEDGDPELIGDICKILSKEIRESEFYQNLDRAYQETLICDLLSGSPIDKHLVVAKLTDIERDMGLNVYLAVVKVPQDSLNQLGYFRDLLKQTQRKYKYYIYSDYIIILISTNNPQLRVNSELRKLRNLFAQENMCAGISCSFENLFELRKHYIEATNALNHGLKSNSDQRIFLYDDIDALPLEN